MDRKANSFLETEKIGTLMWKYSLPCVISLVVAALYNIVDQIFIANADYLGSCGNAANTVVFPLTVVALAIAVMIGDGACAFVSISLGAGNDEEAHRSIGSAILLCLLAGLGLTAAYLLFMDPILTLFGGRVNGETFRNAREYFFWIALGLPFYMFGQTMNPIIRSDGCPRFAMASTVAGAVTNIILDPVFIFPLKMGMMGAAAATVAGQILTAGLSVWYLFHMKAVRLSRRSFGLWGGLMKKYLVLGLTSFLSQVSLVISMAAVQNMCTKYGALDPVFGRAEYAQIPLAVLGIVMKFFQIAISIAVGLAAGCIPVAGYNIGAGRKDRAKALFRRLLIAEAAVGLAALLIVELLPRQLIGIFGAGGESAYYTAFAVRCFRVYLCMMVLAMVNKGAFIYLQALGEAGLSMLISLMREGGVRRGAARFAAPVSGPGRAAVFLPRGGYPDFPHRGAGDPAYVPGAERPRRLRETIPPPLPKLRQRGLCHGKSRRTIQGMTHFHRQYTLGRNGGAQYRKNPESIRLLIVLLIRIC